MKIGAACVKTGFFRCAICIYANPLISTTYVDFTELGCAAATRTRAACLGCVNSPIEGPGINSGLCDDLTVDDCWSTR